MAGVIVDEGRELFLNMILKGADANRGTDLVLGLFITPTGWLSSTSTYGDMTNPNGGNYADITLTSASWSVTGNTATFADQIFIPTVTDYNQGVNGVYLATTGTNPKLIAYEIDPANPVALTTGDGYKISLTVTA